jgi:hypothetical protein
MLDASSISAKRLTALTCQPSQGGNSIQSAWATFTSTHTLVTPSHLIVLRILLHTSKLVQSCTGRAWPGASVGPHVTVLQVSCPQQSSWC